MEMPDTQTLNPGGITGFHTMGRQTGTSTDLDGIEFLTHCPPDLPLRSRILALLAITDIDSMASPSEDGWFVSDFYLFHHLFSPITPPSKCLESH